MSSPSLSFSYYNPGHSAVLETLTHLWTFFSVASLPKLLGSWNIPPGHKDQATSSWPWAWPPRVWSPRSRGRSLEKEPLGPSSAIVSFPLHWSTAASLPSLPLAWYLKAPTYDPYGEMSMCPSKLELLWATKLKTPTIWYFTAAV